MSTYNYTPGLGNAASYQVAGKPFATGSISPLAGPVEINFPAVTSWVTVKNIGTQPIFVGFSDGGVRDGGTNNSYVIDPRSGSFGPVDLKLTQLFLSGSRLDNNSMFVMAGLTSIPIEQLNYASGSVVQLGGRGIQGSNWSGSAGVG
jgi:hypothetical protein